MTLAVDWKEAQRKLRFHSSIPISLNSISSQNRKAKNLQYLKQFRTVERNMN